MHEESGDFNFYQYTKSSKFLFTSFIKIEELSGDPNTLQLMAMGQMSASRDFV